MMRRRLILGLPLAVAACVGILPKPPPPPALYRLTPLRQTASGAPLAAALVVEPPTAPDSLDTTRIALTRGAFGFDYFANAAWTDRATQLVQSLVIRSLEPRIAVVSGPSGFIVPDAILVSALRRFEAAYDGATPPRAEVRLDCLLVRPVERSVMAARSFAARAPAAANDMASIIAAFDHALHAALDPMPDWIARSIGQIQ
ncbi:MAG: ABC-type transport auxiliary lipoprotein family protein [Stellaceae bacterium]